MMLTTNISLMVRFRTGFLRPCGLLHADFMPDHYASLKHQTASTEYDDSFELEDVQSQQQHTQQKRPLIMPRHFHEKLNAYKDGLAGDTDSDSDDEAGRSDSSSKLRGKESLLRRARAEVAGDLEAQPAWATDKKAQNGPLNVCTHECWKALLRES
jgi:hypothetical protein